MEIPNEPFYGRHSYYQDWEFDPEDRSFCAQQYFNLGSRDEHAEVKTFKTWPDAVKQVDAWIDELGIKSAERADWLKREIRQHRWPELRLHWADGVEEECEFRITSGTI